MSSAQEAKSSHEVIHLEHTHHVRPSISKEVQVISWVVFFWQLVANLSCFRNINAKLDNPLRGIPYESLMQDVEVFARERNLDNILSDLKKGALLAQDSQGNYTYSRCTFNDLSESAPHQPTNASTSLLRKRSGSWRRRRPTSGNKQGRCTT